MGNRLQNHRFTAFGRSHDKRALAFADRRNQIDYALGKRGFIHLQRKTFVGVQRSQVFKQRAVVNFIGIHPVYFLHLQHGEIAFVVFGRADEAFNRVAFAKAETFDLGRRNVNIFRAGQVVVFFRAQETETVGQNFKHAAAVHGTVLFGLYGHNAADEFLFAQAGNIFDIVIDGQFGQFLHAEFIQFARVHRFGPVGTGGRGLRAGGTVLHPGNRAAFRHGTGSFRLRRFGGGRFGRFGFFGRFNGFFLHGVFFHNK